ncbi:MAG: DsbA family protein [Burkholderiaceae bacterium]
MQWYFDFISPYAYLQSTRLEQLAAVEPVECVPVLFAGLLNHWGHIGPAELAPKRQWTFEHVTWVAHRDAIDLKMPPHHPFNPLPLLRLSCALGNTAAVVQRLFRWVWAEGNSPADETALKALFEELGADVDALNSPAIKSAVRSNTETAIAQGIFGVPSVSFQGQNFWGDDATEMVLARAASNADETIFPARAMASATAVPMGLTRADSQAGKAPPVSTSREPRLPYQPLDLSEPADLVAAVRARRGGTLLELDRMLLYSAPLTRGWNEFLGAVRTKLSLDPKLGELVICTVAVINGAEFEYGQHAPLFIAAGGTDEQAKAIANPDRACADSSLFSPAERAALQLCLEMTRFVTVNEQTFARCRQHLPDQAVVELVATIASYNMVSRFLVALNIHAQDAH